MVLIHIMYMELLGLRSQTTRLDFSANINPLGPPSSLKEQWGELFQGICQYPDPHTALLKGNDRRAGRKF